MNLEIDLNNIPDESLKCFDCGSKNIKHMQVQGIDTEIRKGIWETTHILIHRCEICFNLFRGDLT